MNNPFVPNVQANPIMNLLSVMQGNPAQAQNLFAQFSRNPAQALASIGYNIPQGMTTPEQIGNYLVSSGQISQPTINQMMQLSPQFRSLFTHQQQSNPPFPQFGGQF